MRLLQVARISRLNEASTGIDKQDQQCQRWADAYSHEIVATAADSNVSGKTDPFSRSELGPWLSEPGLIDKYDGLIAAKLDRYSRSVRYWAHLLDWAREHGKAVICVEPFIDFSTPTGQLVGMIMSWLAEQELEQITQRSNDTKLYLHDNGYVTGKAPFGYTIVQDRDHKTLAPHPEHAPIVRAAVQMYLDGNSLRQVADWLDTQAPAPQGETWSSGSLSSLFRNPALIGRRTDAKGKTILKVEPLIDRKAWEALQARQSARAKTTGAMPKALLTGIAVCGLCGGPMYRLKTNAKGRLYFYYRCHGNERNPSRCKNMIRLDKLDADMDWRMTHVMARWPVYRLITIAGHGHEDEIADVEHDLRDLDFDDPDFAVKQAALLAERKRLRELPMTPTRTEREHVGVIGEIWPTLKDDEARHAFLVNLGSRLVITPGQKPLLEVCGPGMDKAQFLSGSLSADD